MKYERSAGRPRRGDQVDSRDVWAYARRGMAWTEKGEFDQAVADITEAVTIDPKYAFGFRPKGSGALQEEA